MKYVDEYRDENKSRQLVSLIAKEVFRGRRVYKIMEVCGTHTAAIRKFGIRTLLPAQIELISGPGCPVCVTSDGYLRNAIGILKNKKTLLATYPDMLRVPVDGTSLEAERSQGADIVGVNSALEALDLARRFKTKTIVFLAVGFETTAPGTAIAVKTAQKEKISNFSVYSAHKTIPEALFALGKDKDLKINGFLLPGHVSAIIGLDGYRPVMKKLGIASVISGFEPLDILVSVYRIVKAVNDKKAILENEYGRIVAEAGNPRARVLLAEVFKKTDGIWRGLGVIKGTELALNTKFRPFDASIRFGLEKETVPEGARTRCRCAEVLKGKITPHQCPYFGKACTPKAPMGPCMVSREGTCRSYFEYR
jgi:hydrogenase expression/formation protein HypD